MDRYVIIHGTKGSPEGNWFSWLARKLHEQGATVDVPRFPTPEGQTLTRWLSSFAEQVGELDHRSCLIGHSVGATFVLRYLERRISPIGCSVFVAGLTGVIGIPEYDACNSSFVQDPFEWDLIRKNAGKVICFAGDDDPYVPLAQSRQIAECLRGRLTIIPGGGHLNRESGFDSFPQLLDALTRREANVSRALRPR